MALGRYWLSVDGMPLLQPAVVGLVLVNLLFFPIMRPTADVNGQRVAAWPTLAWPFGFPTTEESGSRKAASASEDVGSSVIHQFLRLNVTRAVERQQYVNDLFANRQPMYDKEKGIRADAVFGPRPLDLAHENPRISIAELKGVSRYEWLDTLLYVPGTIGGSSGLALLFGLCLLVFARAVSMLTPLLALFVLFAGLTITGNANVAVHLLSGPTLLGFFYLVADPTCAPRSRRGRALSGIFAGLLEWVLRFVMVEGAVITAVAAQGFSFLLDQYVAPPKEEPQTVHARMSITSLGRL
jgi:Na+-transporting NADH:ubiquinone oxidoreductase subunit NqrB